jgi:hypothetical protein
METETEQTLDAANAYQVSSVSESLDAQLMLIAIKSKLKTLTEERLAITRPLDASKAKVMTLYRRPMENLEQAKQRLDAALIAFAEKQHVSARQTQVQADHEHEVERLRLLQLRDEAEAAGKVDLANEYDTQAISLVPAFIPNKPVTVTGLSYRDVWKWRLVNVAHIHEAFKMPDEVKINAVVRTSHMHAVNIVGAGIEVYSEKIIASRSQP